MHASRTSTGTVRSIARSLALAGCLWASHAAAEPSRYLVHFPSGRFDLSPVARKQIEEAADRATAGTIDRVVCIGHTDARGTPEGNNILSVRRANAVKEALVRAGVPETAILLIGRGSQEPLAGRGGASRDRRVEIVLRIPMVRPDGDIDNDGAEVP